MVTDQELASCVETLLRQAGPTVSVSNISVPNLVRHLEAKLGLDLSHKEPFICNQVAFLLSPQIQKDRFAPASFQQFQYRNPSNLALAAAAASSPCQGQQELSFKYQAAPELVGATSTLSGTSVEASAEPVRDNAKPAAVTVAVAGSKENTPNPAKRKGGPGGLNKPCGVSPELEVIVGQPTMARTEIMRQLWAYIHKNNLQDPNNKRKIICNDELRVVFKTDYTDMFKMNKLLAKHIITLNEPTREVRPEAKKSKEDLSADVVSFDNTGIDEYPIMISDALAHFFGTKERKMLHAEALGRVWDHIKSNHLEDPQNAMVILCDSKLKQLFGCESVSALGISELLSRHCFTQS